MTQTSKNVNPQGSTAAIRGTTVACQMGYADRGADFKNRPDTQGARCRDNQLR
jgi:hypothetical protein